MHSGCRSEKRLLQNKRGREIVMETIVMMGVVGFVLWLIFDGRKIEGGK
jgi:hypothetical protein